MMLENADGTKSTAEIKAGNAYSKRAGVRHKVINLSEKLMTFIEIELKN